MGFSPFVICERVFDYTHQNLLHRFYLLLLKVRTEKTKFLINERERFFFDEKEVIECMWVVVFVPGSSICRSLLWCCDLRYNYELYGPYRQYISGKHNCCKSILEKQNDSFKTFGAFWYDIKAKHYWCSWYFSHYNTHRETVC